MLARLSGPEALRKAAFAVAALLLLGVVYLAWPSTPQKTATVYFPRTVHVYAGGDVDVLGIKVGSITAVKPDGDRVRVDIKYTASQRIPANASAVILTPTLVADRVVQLTPAYTGGAVLADKSVIPLQRTGVPLELDEVFKNLNDLSKDLGPNGANSTGALSRLFSVSAANLDGEGNNIHTTINSIADLTGTLDDNKGALFQTVRNLQAFTDTLAQHDADTRAFTTDLAKVGEELNGDRTALAAAFHNLNLALGDVTQYIADNKANVADNIAALARVTNVLVKDKDLLAKLLQVGALGATNYPHVYDPATRSFDGGFSENPVFSTPALFACSVAGAVGLDAQNCYDILKSAGLDKIKIPSGPPSGSSNGPSQNPTSLGGMLGIKQ